jgi:hypothetical protein
MEALAHLGYPLTFRSYWNKKTHRSLRAKDSSLDGQYPRVAAPFALTSGTSKTIWNAHLRFEDNDGPPSDSCDMWHAVMYLDPHLDCPCSTHCLSLPALEIKITACASHETVIYQVDAQRTMAISRNGVLRNSNIGSEHPGVRQDARIWI